MEEEELSDAWTGFIRFVLLKERPPEGYTLSGWRLTRKQRTFRPDDVWPHTSKKCPMQQRRKQNKDGLSKKNQSSTMPAYTQVKMEDAPKLKISKSECPYIWIRLPRHRWPKSWSSMEDPVVPLERNLHGHPLAGLLWERQFEKILTVRLLFLRALST